jgi:endoglucanase
MKKIIVALFIFGQFALFAQDSVSFVRLNLVGYTNYGPKRALIISKKKLEQPVYLFSFQTNQPITLPLIPSQQQSWPPFFYNYEVDFSSIIQTGDYRIQSADGTLQSAQFHIGSYPALFEDVIHFLQTQRCGYNPYIDAVCHSLDGRSFYGDKPDKSYVDARGGWHDAGDQLKYLITGSNATARMLQAWEWNKKAFGDQVNAWGQQGANGIPDILDEAKWGLDWIHRLHCAPDQLIHQVADDRDHLGFKLPTEDPADYGFGVNKDRPAYFATGKPQGLGKYKSEATGVANLAGRSAAAMAMGYRIWSKDLGDLVFAQQCLRDAKELYAMGKAKEGYQQGNSFGAPYRYNENTWADDMEWGAAELYRATGEKQYLKDAIHYAQLIGDYSWMEKDSVAHYEMYPYVNMGHYALWQVAPDTFKKKLINYYAHNLQRIQAKAALNDYGVGHLFVWCSNNFAAAVATQAILYERMTGSHRYTKLMQDHINWLLGLNPWGTSMITGIPSNGDFPLDVHMPFWRIKKEVIKGSLVDGPIWSSIHEGMLHITLSQPDEYKLFQPTHITYWDDWADYSTNEPTMDGSADLLLLLTHLFSVGKGQ